MPKKTQEKTQDKTLEKTPAKPTVAKPTVAEPKAAKRPAAKLAAVHEVLAVGSRAPAFSLPRDGDGTVSLKDFAGQNLVIFFYPRAGTPGCTREAVDFSRLASAFAAKKTAILGVSADPIKAQDSFSKKHLLKFPLASDELHTMLEAYGVWAEKAMYGKTFMGIVRTTVLIDASGRIKRVWRKVKVDGHADDVLGVILDKASDTVL